MSTKVTRRDFVKGLAAAAGASVLAACTPQVVKETVVVEKIVKETVVVEAAPVEPTTLTYWMRSSSGRWAALTGVVEGFQLANRNVVVDFSDYPSADYQSKVAASVAADTGPDVVHIYYGWAPLWKREGFIVPLPDGLQTELDEGFSSLTKVTKLDGKHYAVPPAIFAYTLFYNVGLFAEVGLTRAPETFAEFREYAMAATKYDAAGNITQAGFFSEWSESGWNHWRSFIRGFGGTPFSEDGREVLFNQGEARTAWQYLSDLILKDKVMTDDFFVSTTSAFVSGKSAMHISASSGWNRDIPPDMEWDTAPLPAGPAGQFSVGGTWPSCLTLKAAQDPAKLEVANLFLEYMASQEGQTRYTAIDGTLPARLDMMDMEKYTEHKVLRWPASLAEATYAPFWCDELAERQCCLDMFDSVMITGADPMEALDQAASCVQTVRDDFFQYW